MTNKSEGSYNAYVKLPYSRLTEKSFDFGLTSQEQTVALLTNYVITACTNPT